MKLLLVRHGQTDWNLAGRFQGQSDTRLNRTGQRQAAAVSQVLRLEAIQAVYASDLQRARETARCIAAGLRLTVQLEPRLREMAFGQWEGLTYAEIQQRQPEALVAWQKAPQRRAPPHGETLAQVADRVRQALKKMVKAHTEETIVLVAHGGPLRILLCLALGLPPQAYWQFAMQPGSLSELHMYDEGAILTRLNDTHHLHEADDDSTGRHDSGQ
jgi:alpha-ribazole phosphatase